MKNNAFLKAEVNKKIEFYDLDPMQIVWHGNYIKYFEEARCALLDQIDYNYDQMDATGYHWPIVDLRVKYVSSAKFKQRVVIIAELVEYQNRMKIEYKVIDQDTEKVLTKGHSIQAAINIVSGEMEFVSPKVFLDKLHKHL